jgi:hypothetical protein
MKSHNDAGVTAATGSSGGPRRVGRCEGWLGQVFGGSFQEFPILIVTTVFGASLKLFHEFVIGKVFRCC